MRLALFSTLLPAAVGGQTASPDVSGRTGSEGMRVAGPVQTLIAVPGAFPDIDAVSMLVRTPGRDVVVLHPDHETVETLMMSLSLLRRVRATRPAPTQGQLIPVTGYAVTREPSAADRRRLAAALARLARAPETAIGDLGPGRWVPFAPGGS